MKKSHPASLKFKVALAALTGQPVVDICKQYEIAESLVHRWKKYLKDNGTAVFQSVSKGDDSGQEEMDKLYQRIGKLTTELEFLKKILGN
jgi:transposase-like protein